MLAAGLRNKCGDLRLKSDPLVHQRVGAAAISAHQHEVSIGFVSGHQGAEAPGECKLLGWGTQSFGGRPGVWASYIGESPGPHIPRATGNTLVGRVFMVPTDGALLMLHMQSPATSPEQASTVRLRYEPLWNAVAASFSVASAKP